MDPQIDKKRGEIVHGILEAGERIARSEARTTVSISPLIGRLESGGLSGIGPKLSLSFPMPGDGALRNSIRFQKLEINDRENREKEELGRKDFEKAVDNQVQALALDELSKILNEVDREDKLKPLKLRIEYSKERAKEKAEIYRSETDSTPLQQTVLKALNQFEGEFVSTITSVGAKTRPWWKKIIPSKLNIGVEPLSISRSVTPLGVAGLEFYRGPKGRVSDQLLELTKSTLNLKGELDLGVRETYLSLVNLRDNPKRVLELKNLLGATTEKGAEAWEIVTELQTVLTQNEQAKLTIKKWIGLLPDVRGSSNENLLEIAKNLVQKGIRERIPHLDDLKEELQEKVKKLKGDDKKLAEAALQEIRNLDVINSQTGKGQENLVKAERITPSYSPKVKTSVEIQSGYQAGGDMSELPGFPVLGKNDLSQMVSTSVTLPRRGKKELYAQYFEARKEVNRLSSERLRIEDEVRANVVNDQIKAGKEAFNSSPSDLGGDFARLKAKRIVEQNLEEQKFLKLNPTSISELPVLGPEYYQALYKKAELEIELLRRGYKDVVISGMFQNDGKISHQFLSLDLSTLTEKPVRALFRKIFRRGERPEVIAARKNLELIAYEASQEFLDMEMERERAIENVLTRVKTLSPQVEDDRERRANVSKGDRLNKEYNRWEVFINSSREDPKYQKTKDTPKENKLVRRLGEAFDRDLGRDEPISRKRSALQREILSEFYSKNLEDVEISNGFFIGNTAPKQAMNRYGGTFGFNYNNQRSIWNRSDILRGIEEIDKNQIDNDLRFFEDKQEAIIRAENKLGVAKYVGELIDELSKKGDVSNELLSRAKRVQSLFRIKAEDALREVGLTLTRIRVELVKDAQGKDVDVLDIEAKPRDFDSSILAPIDLTKDAVAALSSRLNPGIAGEEPVMRRHLADQQGVAFVGNRSFGVVGSLGSFPVVESGERTGRNQRAEKLEELQESERQLSISRNGKEIELLVKRITQGAKSLSNVSRECWKSRERLQSGLKKAEGEATYLIDNIIQYFSLREEVEAESLRLYLLSSYGVPGGATKFVWQN